MDWRRKTSHGKKQDKKFSLKAKQYVVLGLKIILSVGVCQVMAILNTKCYFFVSFVKVVKCKLSDWVVDSAFVASSSSSYHLVGGDNPLEDGLVGGGLPVLKLLDGRGDHGGVWRVVSYRVGLTIHYSTEYSRLTIHYSTVL